MTKLKLIKEKVKKWNGEVFGDLRLQKQSLLKNIKEVDALESSGNWNNQLREERFIGRSKLENILLKEEREIRLKTNHLG